MPLELDYIEVEGFRSIRSQKVELQAMNVLIGPNGAGKSNFIEAFAFLHALRQGRLIDYTDRSDGANALLHFGAKRTSELHLQLSFLGGVNGYTCQLAPTDEDRFFVTEERCWYWDRQKYPEKPYSVQLRPAPDEAGISREQERTARWVQQRLDRWRIYHFHDTSASSPMKSAADVEDNRFFRPDGANLAPFLMLLRERHPREYSLIRRTVQRVTPFFDDFQLAPLLRNPDKMRLEWRHRSSDDYFGVSTLSDGTLRFICLAVLLLQPAQYRPSVIIVDEPELGLHPYAITMLASLFQAAASHTQVIVATQSPLLLDHCTPEQVVVADLEDGATTFGRLDPAALEGWLEDYSLGQLWEKNELGGRPSRG